MKITYLKRHQKILDCLEKLDEQTYVTGTELSKLCDVSTKTIRSDIHDINTFLQSNAQILSKPGKGYYLHILSSKYKSEKDKYLRQEGELLDNSIQRSYYIMRQLLLNDQPIRIEELSTQMYIDRTSVSRDMKYVREYLSKFHLKVEYKVGKGNYIIGDELHKRLCMEDIFNQYSLDQLINIEIDIKQQMSEILDRDGISMTDASLDDMVKYLSIMMLRINENHCVKMSEEEKTLLKSEYEYQVARDIVDFIKTYYDIKINEEEICFLTVHLIGKRINYISDIESCLVDVLPERIENKMMKLFLYLNEIYGIDFSDDFYLKKALGVHILAMENRMRFDTYLKNPMLKMIKKNYLLAYLISVDIWLFLHPELNVIYSEDEIAYFTIHIQYSLMRNHLKNKKRVLLINNLNSSSTELLSYELLQEFDEFMEIVDSIHIRQLEDIHMEKYDLVISTSAISQATIPFIQISPILDQTSIHKIRNYFMQIEHYSLGDFIKPKNILLNSSMESKTEVLQYISKLFQFSFSELDLKENVGNMAMEGHIVIPQMIGYSDIVEEMLITFNKPIIWDHEFIQCVLFVSLPKRFFLRYQGYYSLLQKLVMDQEAIEKILSFQKTKEVEEFLSRYH
ncbi:BglG family transcription antiterminator [Longibaculum muris]|uniref:BglG family transcription antiterminator n=1 Tax=Longibaculum muris TaxID=1796628 RepID=UPI0022E818F7|nr:BglG family transcription antiterminator [Longibaculum muris]